MIARTWGGATRAADADRYLAYLHRTGLSAYQGTPGNAGVLALRRVRGDRDDAFLVDRDLQVDHFEVVFASDIAALDAAGGA
jgi:hypothetical protein